MPGVKLATAYYELVPSMGGNQAAISQQMGAAGKTGGAKFSSGFKAAALAGLVVAGAAAAKFISGAIAEAQESAKIGATTTQLIKNQGNAASVTADQVGKLATSISNKTGVDDEAIQSGQNLLLSFQSVQNQAGAGNAIFNRASQAIVDLGTKMGSPEAAAKVLGKALNDPVKGMAALTRAGVPLTKSQQEQVKAFAEAGDTLGAQRVILDAVEQKMGGVAAASSTGAEKMATAWGNFKESIGAAFLPVVEAVTAALTPLLQQITSSPAAMTAVAVVLGGAVAGAFIAAAVAAWAFVAPMLAMALPFILIGIAIAALVVAIVVLVKHWDIVKAKTIAVWNAIKGFLLKLWDGIKSKAAAAWDAIKTKTSQAWDKIKSTIQAKGEAVVKWFRDLPGKLLKLFVRANLLLLSVGEDLIRGIVKGIGNGFKWVKAKIVELGGNVLGWAKDILKIGSPSKVMAEHVGRWIPAGIAMGIDQNASLVQSSMTGVVSGLATNARLVAVGTGTTAASGPRQMYLRSGELELRGGKAYVTGIISEQAFQAGVA